MKKTGMVRKLDELGRIVIPKEIRNVLKLKVGMQLEIYINESGELVLKEFYPVTTLKSLAEDFVEILHNLLEKDVFVCDRKQIVAYSGDNKKMFINKNISDKLLNLLTANKNYVGSRADNTTLYSIIDDEIENLKSELFFSLMFYGEPEGLIGILNFKDDKITEQDIKSLELASKFIQRQLENE